MTHRIQNHGYTRLGKILLKEAKNDTKEIEEALYCFDQAIDAQATDKDLLHEIYLGRAKTNLLIAQFGKVKEDALEAKKHKESEQLYVILIRSRLFVEKYKEAIEYAKEGLKKYPE